MKLSLITLLVTMSHGFTSMAAIASAPEGMREVPPNASELRYPGSVVADVNAERTRFSRVIQTEQGLEHDAPGTRIIFRTDATVIVARFQANGLRVRDAVNGVGAVVVDGKKSSNYEVQGPDSGVLNVPVLESTDAALRDVEIWLPYAESVDFLGLTVNKTARILPLTLPAKPRYVAYGDSITQGFRAVDVLATYPVLVAKACGWELTNLGFGWRQATAEDGRAIGSLPADIITILIGFNDYHMKKPLDRYRADVRGILQNIRARQPTTPIFLITALWSAEEAHSTNPGSRLEDYRQVLREVAAKAKDANLHLVEGADLIPSDAVLFSDGIHPNDDGSRILAEKLVPRLQLHAANAQP